MAANRRHSLGVLKDDVLVKEYFQAVHDESSYTGYPDIFAYLRWKCKFAPSERSNWRSYERRNILPPVRLIHKSLAHKPFEFMDKWVTARMSIGDIRDDRYFDKMLRGDGVEVVALDSDKYWETKRKEQKVKRKKIHDDIRRRVLELEGLGVISKDLANQNEDLQNTLVYRDLERMKEESYEN